MPTYEFNLYKLMELYKKKEYSNCIIKSAIFLQTILEAFLVSVYSYLDQTKKIPIFRKFKPTFSQLIKESKSHFMITRGEEKILENLRDIRNKASHNLHFDEIVKVGQELKDKDIYRLVKDTEKLFLILKERYNQFNNISLKESFESDEKDINKIYAKRNINTLKKVMRNIM